MDWSVYWFMFPACIAIATIAMMSGISGAALLSPAIIIGFPLIGVPTIATGAAIGMSLFTEFFGFGSGVVGYARRKLIDYRTVRILAFVAVPVAAVASFVSQEIEPSILKGIYGVMMVPLAVILWRQAAEQLRPGTRNPNPQYSPIKNQDQEFSRIVDSDGNTYKWKTCNRKVGLALTGFGATMSGLISTGIGEVEMPQLVKRCRVPIAIAAGTSIMIVAITVLAASVAHILALLDEAGIDGVPWNLIVYTVPGAIIGGQIGSRLQGRVSPRVMERSMSVLFLFIGLVFLASVTFLSGLAD